MRLCAEQATATRRASSPALSFRGAPGRAVSMSARVKPSRRNAAIHRRGADPDVCRNPFVGDLGVGGEDARLIWRAARVPRGSAPAGGAVLRASASRDMYVHGYLGSHGRCVQSVFTAKPWPSSTPTHYSTGSRRPKPTSNVLSGHSPHGPRHDRRAGAARADQPRPTAAPDDQAGTGGR